MYFLPIFKDSCLQKELNRLNAKDSSEVGKYFNVTTVVTVFFDLLDVFIFICSHFPVGTKNKDKTSEARLLI